MKRMCMRIGMIIGFSTLGIATVKSYAEQNYGEALQKSLYFYECQQSGPLPDWNRVQWRGPSCINDGADVGKDLTGGWFDAGDHVKFNFPMAFSNTMLCWGVVDYRDAYEKSGQLSVVLNNIRFTADYLMRCHTAQNEFYGQVGNGGLDHAFWGPAESVESQMKRPSYKIDADKPGSDLAGEAAAALSAASIAFKTEDPAYSEKCLTHAKQLYEFANNYRGKYSDAISDAQGYYNSWSGYIDELVWGAIWLYRATKDSVYLSKAEKYYDSLSTEPQSTIKSFKWTIAWDDKSYGNYVLLAILTGKQKYKDDAERWLDYWTVGVNGQKIYYTPGGLAWLSEWGSCRYAANTAFLAFMYSDAIANATHSKEYHDFAVKQINYALGDNPLKRSLVVGYGTNPPQREHHRTAHGIYPGQASDTNTCAHILYGALVGGPGKNDDYTDERNNYTNNEVACDYNAAFTGALVRMYKEFGGTPLEKFPEKEAVKDQFNILANLNASGDRFTEIKAILRNQTNSPARVCTKLSYRYIVDLSEAVAAGIAVKDITLRSNYLQGKTKISGLIPYPDSKDIYYIEVSCDGDSLYPGTQDSYKREAQFRIELPQNATGAAWNPSNDWSYKFLGPSAQSAVEDVNMPIFDNGVQIWGADYNKTILPVIKPVSTQLLNDKRVYHVSIAGKMLFVKGAETEDVNISFILANGQTVYSLKHCGNKGISLENLHSGIYFCKIINSKSKTVFKQSIVIKN